MAEIFKDPDNKPNWPRIGVVLAAVIAGAWTAVTYLADHKGAHDKSITIVYVFDQRAATALTAQLISESQTPAGPGKREAVGEAVQSITQGAAEGDPRLQQAFRLLKENKFEDAIQLLKAFASGKEARAEAATAQPHKDPKEAAAAYRNLGAIAGLRDPKRALEAYAKAIELDPNDRESLYWHGWLSLLAGQLSVGEQNLGRLLKLASEVGDQRGIYRANLRLGELAKERGNLAVCLEYEEEAEKIAVEQVDANAGNLEWQRELSVAYEKIGDVQVAQGDLAGALKSFQDSLA
ncbi:MAG TPA: hypothetical protein VHT48_02285, partial [Methylocella sp.]|nr:hypothetical protein [Methylocella sp.]